MPETTTYEPMDPKLKRRWVRALRSRKYKQGREQLRDGNKFCCLGVLCDLVPGRKWADTGAVTIRSSRYFSTAPSFLVENGAQENLIAMNDGSRGDANPIGTKRTFATIATWIEKNL